MENEKIENAIFGKALRAFAILALLGGVVFAGVATYEIVFNTFFATTTAGVSTTGFTPPTQLTKGSIYVLTGSFDNVANQAHTIIPSVQFIADTGFADASEFGAISLNGNAGTCALDTTTVLGDTMNCEFAGISLDEAGGIAPSTGDIDLNFEVPLMWDGSELNLAMQYTE